jgi:hypothetical protein
MFSEENYASMYDYKSMSKDELRLLQVRVAELQAGVEEELRERELQDMEMEERHPQAGEFLHLLFNPHAYIYMFAGASLNQSVDILARLTLN